jgi:Arc/MetJ-type ribon-helix-helix transcriptional regulator
MNQTINISLPKKLAQLAQNQVKSGYYTSVSEVIRDALRNSFTTPSIPVYKMSKQAEKVALQAKKDYQDGNVIEFTDVNELFD